MFRITRVDLMPPPLWKAELTTCRGDSEKTAKTSSFRISLLPFPSRLNCCILSQRHFSEVFVTSTIMALLGHKFAHTPHCVQENSSTTCGLLFSSNSRIPRGQEPTQINSGHGLHLASLTETFALRLPMESQQLNKRRRYICCAGTRT